MNSSMSFGGWPAAGMTVGFATSRTIGKNYMQKLPGAIDSRSPQVRSMPTLQLGTHLENFLLLRKDPRNRVQMINCKAAFSNITGQWTV
jgi:hypothetical protein